MDKYSNEIKIGLTVGIALIISFFGFRYMKDVPLLKSSKLYYIKFSQVDGLTTGNMVSVKGFKVGSVYDMRFLQEEDSALVVISVGTNIVIPQGTVATVKSSGPLGNKFVELIRGNSPVELEDGAYIPGVFEVGFLDSFSEKGEAIADNVNNSLTGLDELLQKLNSTLDEKNRDNISGLLENLEKTTSEVRNSIEQRKGDVEEMMNSLKNILQNTDDLSAESKEQLQSILENLDNSTSELQLISKNLTTTTQELNIMLEKINAGEGTVGKLMNDPSLYNNLDSLSANLSELIKNMNDDPRKFLKHLKIVDVF